MLNLTDVRNGRVYRSEGDKDPRLTAQARYHHSLTPPGHAFTPDEDLAGVYLKALRGRHLYELNIPKSIEMEFYRGTITVAGVKGEVLDIPPLFSAHKRLIK